MVVLAYLKRDLANELDKNNDGKIDSSEAAGQEAGIPRYARLAIRRQRSGAAGSGAGGDGACRRWPGGARGAAPVRL